jgi:hypothetical protein
MKIKTLFHRLEENCSSFLIDMIFENFTSEQFENWLENNESRLDVLCEKYNTNVEILGPEQLIRFYL